MTIYSVYFTKEAEQDLVEIWHYVAREDLPPKADKLLEELERACIALRRFPLRGRVPSELSRIQVMDYRELVAKPYRIFYQVIGKRVFIHAVLDGRRNMIDLLQRRLLSWQGLLH